MDKELLALLEQINNKKEEVRNLAKENKIEEAKAAKEELKNLNAKFELLADLETEEEKAVKDAASNGKMTKITNTAKDTGKSFVNIIKAALRKGRISDEDEEVYNMMKEGTDEDGGLTVPEDISTKIKELRRSDDALENYVNVENVKTIKGSRVYELSADQIPFDNVDEAAEFPEFDTPKLRKITYDIKKKGGILGVTRELLNDSAENILAFLRKWISKKAKATRNALIIKQIDTITAGKEVAITNFDDLKDIYNVSLDPAVSISSICLTNQDGFNVLDKMKDTDGKYILQPDPTKATQMLLFGKYPVIKVANKTLKSSAGKAPVICGDLKEAITIFDLENLSIEFSTEAGELWYKDMTGIKVRERLDIQTIDEEAVIKGLLTVGE